jgi:archaellum component FlaF (FlaF/FlaG flagellin family)
MFHLKYKNPILVLLLAIAVLINGAIIYLIYEQGRLSVEDSSAAVEPKLVLNLNTPASTEGMAAGSNFKLDVKVQSPNGTSVSELVLKFDPAILEAKLITESSNLLALNKKIDNVAGKATIDVSTSGSGAFAETLTLATFEFTLKTAGGNTAGAVDPASTT